MTTLTQELEALEKRFELKKLYSNAKLIRRAIDEIQTLNNEGELVAHDLCDANQKIDKANDLLEQVYESGISLQHLEEPIHNYLVKD